MKIGELIKNLRVKRGLTQEELGGYINRSKNAVSMMENDKHFPRLETLDLLAKKMGVPVSYFALGLINVEDVAESKRDSFIILYEGLKKLIYDESGIEE